MKKILIAIAVAQVAVFAFAGSASASPALETTDWKHKASALWSENGVPEGTQQKLIEKIKKFGLTDAELGVEPVRSASVKNADSVKTVDTYPDGSIAVSVTERPDVSPKAVSGCTLTTYSGVAQYTNCHVTAETAVTSIGFLASFTIVSGGSNDYIVNKGALGVQNCGPGTCSKPAFSSWRQHETSSAKAYLRYSSTYSTPVTTVTLFVRVTVGGNSYTSSAS